MSAHSATRLAPTDLYQEPRHDKLAALTSPADAHAAENHLNARDGGERLRAPAFGRLEAVATRPMRSAPAIGLAELTLRLLRERYLELAVGLAPQSNGAPATSNATPDASPALADTAVAAAFSPNGVPADYLADILFFRRFSPEQIDALRNGLQVLSAPRDSKLDIQGRLWIVLRGAVQTSLCDGTARRRVWLAGPGRCVGHLAITSDQPALEATLRERAVLLEVPHERARALLASDTPSGQRFAEAFHEDVIRALQAAEAPLPPNVAAHQIASTAPDRVRTAGGGLLTGLAKRRRGPARRLAEAEGSR